MSSSPQTIQTSAARTEMEINLWEQTSLHQVHKQGKLQCLAQPCLATRNFATDFCFNQCAPKRKQVLVEKQLNWDGLMQDSRNFSLDLKKEKKKVQKCPKVMLFCAAAQGCPVVSPLKWQDSVDYSLTPSLRSFSQIRSNSGPCLCFL